MRQYDLSDHLGNVLVSVLDRKVGGGGTRVVDYPITYAHNGIMLPDVASATVYNYRKADVASAQDYFPFDMIMPQEW